MTIQSADCAFPLCFVARLIAMETATIAQQEASATEKVTSDIQSDSDSLTQVQI